MDVGVLRSVEAYSTKCTQSNLQYDGPTFVALLKHCAKVKNLVRGTKLHAEIAKTCLLESDLFVGNSLIDMYAKCNKISKAQEVFDELKNKDIVSWNALIGGYIKIEDGKEALICYEEMQLEGILPNEITYVYSLKACGISGSVTRGRRIHGKVLMGGMLARNIYVGNALIDMYSKCGFLLEAQEVSDGLIVRDVVSWNALIAGYVKHNATEMAFDCFKMMQSDGVSPSLVTYLCILKACAAVRAADKGWEIHAQIDKEGLLEGNFVVGVAVVDMYVKCGLLAKALDVFYKLPSRDVASWMTMIVGYVKHECPKRALECAEQMQLEGILGNDITLVCALKSCSMIGAIEKGKRIHMEIAETGLSERAVAVGNALVDMYAKCGLLKKSYGVSNDLAVRDVVTWTSLLSGYVRHECGEEALNCYEEMQLEGVLPNEVSFICSLKACVCIGSPKRGYEIHSEIARKGLLDGSLVVGNALVDMYAKCGLIDKAHEVFDSLLVRDVVSWTAMIAGYTLHLRCQHALSCFQSMTNEGILPNCVTFLCMLEACGCLGAIGEGEKLHIEILLHGFSKQDRAVGNALIETYAKCGLFIKALETFDGLSDQDVISWTALIAGYVQHDCAEEALFCFEHMRVDGVFPNAVTFIFSLQACGSIGARDKGTQIHAQILELGLVEEESTLGNALIDMYAKCGCFDKAKKVFDRLLDRDVVAWNAHLSGLVKHDFNREALNYFDRMQAFGVLPDHVSFVCSLKACGSLGAIKKGCLVHMEIARKRLLDTDPGVGNALVDMYSNCGLLSKAQEVFDNLIVCDTVSWNSLIAGHVTVGETEKVFSIFDNMRNDGSNPDSITFTSILQACSLACLVDRGLLFFEAVSKEYGMSPSLEHHTCMIDLLGQAGHLDKAAALITRLPVQPDHGLLHTLLDGCQIWGNVDVARKAFEHAMHLDGKDAPSYVRMSNIYMDAATNKVKSSGSYGSNEE